MDFAGIAFFGLVLAGDSFAPVLGQYGLTPLMAAVLVGAAQNVFSKSAKYSLFDPCKEMAYIPLDQELQLKGKAAIDVVCNPLGKSGGSAIQQVWPPGVQRSAVCAGAGWHAVQLFHLCYLQFRHWLEDGKRF